MKYTVFIFNDNGLKIASTTDFFTTFNQHFKKENYYERYLEYTVYKMSIYTFMGLINLGFEYKPSLSLSINQMNIKCYVKHDVECIIKCDDRLSLHFS